MGMRSFVSCSSLNDFQFEDTTTGTTQTVLTITWTAAIDNISPHNSLQYQVYSSLSNNIFTLINTLANGTAFDIYTANKTNHTLTVLMQNNPYFFQFCFAAWDGVSFRFKGAIDDIRIYGEELSQTEIINLANLPAD